MHTLQSIVLYICSNSMQFWQCSILLQFLQIINAKDFAFRSLQNLQSSTSADCTVSLHAMVHCNPKCIAVIPLQFHCNYLQCTQLGNQIKVWGLALVLFLGDLAWSGGIKTAHHITLNSFYPWTLRPLIMGASRNKNASNSLSQLYPLE